jgi:drug/metabolite transporter (DMT)-like permease
VGASKPRLYSATDGARSVPSAFVSAGPFWRSVRTLLVQRQPALVYPIAIVVMGTALDLVAAALRHQFHSFSAFSRVEFDNEVLWRAVASLGDAPIAISVLVLLTLPVVALLTGWLSTCYLVALGEGRYSLRAPRRTVTRLATLLLPIDIALLLLSGLDDNGLPALALPIGLLLVPFTLYADYAIVLDDVGPVEGVRRSLRVFRARPRESILIVVSQFLVAVLTAGAFVRGFRDATHVQPGYLGAWLLVNVLIGFVIDVLLLTLYRSTPLSEAGSGDRPEASRSREASD